jgi:hypothetical protein
MYRFGMSVWAVLLLVGFGAFGCAKPRPIGDVMQEYCKAADANRHWCGKAADIPVVQQWEIIEGYCGDVPNVPRRAAVVNPSGPVCEAFAKAEHPFALVYNMRRKSWSANGAFKERPRQGAVDLNDPTGKPSVYLSKGKQLGVVVEQVNPAAYRAEQGETTVRDIEGIQNIQAVLTAAGGALGSLASIAALVLPDAPAPVAESKAEEARNEAAEALNQVQTMLPQQAFEQPLERAEKQIEDRDFKNALKTIESLRKQVNSQLATTVRGKAIADLRAARTAVIEADEATIEAERQRQQAADTEAALRADLAVITAATDRVNEPLRMVRSHVERLDRQMRRVQAIGRGLNETSQQIGREFDTVIEQPATWTKVFETLRMAQQAADSEIGACKTLLERYQAVVSANADKPVEVQVAAIDFRRELALEPGKIRSSCALPNIQPLLKADVEGIEAAASELSLRVSSEWVANAGRLRAAQVQGRNRLAMPAGVLLRQTAAFTSVLSEVEKILAKEVDIKKQAAVSQMLTDRVRNASLRKFGGVPPGTTYSCDPSKSLASASAMSLKILNAPAATEAVTVTIALYDSDGNPMPPRSVPVSRFAANGDDIPLGITDVDYYRGCSSLQVIVDGNSVPARVSDFEVVVHPGYLVANRLFVHERLFEGSLTKVQTDKFIVSLSQPKDLELVVDGPAKVESAYDVSRRQGQLFGANVGVIYTPAFSRTFTLVDPTPSMTVQTTTTEESGTTKQVTTFLEKKRVEEQSRESRAGQVAAFLNVRLLQALWPQSARHFLKPGVEIGFGMDTAKPSILAGVSLEVFRYFRFGGGRAWVSTTDAKDPSLIDTEVDPAFVMPTETKFRKSWYASVTFALDSLTLFSGK